MIELAPEPIAPDAAEENFAADKMVSEQIEAEPVTEVAKAEEVVELSPLAEPEPPTERVREDAVETVEKVVERETDRNRRAESG